MVGAARHISLLRTKTPAKNSVRASASPFRAPPAKTATHSWPRASPNGAGPFPGERPCTKMGMRPHSRYTALSTSERRGTRRGYPHRYAAAASASSGPSRSTTLDALGAAMDDAARRCPAARRRTRRRGHRAHRRQASRALDAACDAGGEPAGAGERHLQAQAENEAARPRAPAYAESAAYRVRSPGLPWRLWRGAAPRGWRRRRGEEEEELSKSCSLCAVLCGISTTGPRPCHATCLLSASLSSNTGVVTFRTLSRSWGLSNTATTLDNRCFTRCDTCSRFALGTTSREP